MSSKRPQVLFFLIFLVDAISAILSPPPKVSDNKSFFNEISSFMRTLNKYNRKTVGDRLVGLRRFKDYSPPEISIGLFNKHADPQFCREKGILSAPRRAQLCVLLRWDRHNLKLDTSSSSHSAFADNP